ncbi:peptide ABC transporter substrate-binding protein [Halorubrum sp. CBA1125]|uniref:ABC transporter substrate-binding protein n=1 Tax=Halorubrum sp. CBA1125 TaxID=2668072 RepID=UPI0012E7E2D4|nr:ABC transporter substrate-binding protein [Halorubrum sp. CBA1125]MUW13898.1 peptide ABC transporter substrate-binding protein [Halorubrum sp. CBA1125]
MSRYDDDRETVGRARGHRRVGRRRVLAALSAGGTAGLAGCGALDPGFAVGSDDDGDIGADGDGPFPLAVRFQVNGDNDDRVRAVERIAASMERTGYFDVRVETRAWEAHVDRVLDPAADDEGAIPSLGVSGTSDPDDFCRPLNHTAGADGCCNATGAGDAALDDLIDAARFTPDAAADETRRAERYDAVWRALADRRYSSVTHFDVQTAVTGPAVHGFDVWPFPEGLYRHAAFDPAAERVAWIDRTDDETETSGGADTGPADRVEGGTLRGVVAAPIASFDPTRGVDTASRLAQSLLFEPLAATGRRGTVRPWLARDIDLLDVADVDRGAYAEHMREVDADEVDTPGDAARVVVRHPDDDPETDDRVRVLFASDAAAAAADGTYGMRYRCSLREGVTFHDGRELTAEDVVATYRRGARSPAMPEIADTLLAAVAVDEYAVDLYAQVPDAAALQTLSRLPVLSAAQIETVDRTDAGAAREIDPRAGVSPVGTGPFALSSFEDGRSAAYDAVDEYWVRKQGVDAIEWFDGGESFPDGPVVDRIELDVLVDAADRVAALRDGTVDVAYGLSPADLVAFDDDEDFRVHRTETGGYECVQYPVDVAPWDDPRLRRAVNHLIPRRAIAAAAAGGFARPAWTPLPAVARGPGTADADALDAAVRPANEYDPDRAVELLERVAADA